MVQFYSWIIYDLDKAHNLKLELYAFEKLSCLKINFHKSKLFCFGEAKNAKEPYTKTLGCATGNFTS